MSCIDRSLEVHLIKVIDIDYLPTKEEQDWLIGQLADLIRCRGKDRFIHAPIVEPTRKFFPDDWEPSNLGVDRSVRRLMQYAGLDDYDIKIELFHALGSAIAGAFSGLENNCCNFQFNTAYPDEVVIAGVMSHEVAHAYRSIHGLLIESSDEDEWATDVTAIYLGFGILAANNSYRYRSEGSWGYQSDSLAKIGYLTPQAFGFVFALQLVARGYSSGECRGILKHLETTQRVLTKKALKTVRSRKEEIFGVLGIEPLDQSSSTIDLSDLLKPLPEFNAAEYIEFSELRDWFRPGFNKGKPVFRVAKSRMVFCCGLGALLGFIPGFIMIVNYLPLWLGFLPLFLGLFAGCIIGRKTGFSECSHPECKTRLTEDDICPNCLGYIAGTIRHEDERLEAMDKLLHDE